METEKKKLAIIGASYLQLPLIEKAKEMGLETHVFAWKANDPGETAADYFYPISIVEKDQILEICRDIKIDGICTIASDLANVTVCYIADKMNLAGNAWKDVPLFTNKHQMRKAFEKAGLPSCKSRKLDFSDAVLEEMKYLPDAKQEDQRNPDTSKQDKSALVSWLKEQLEGMKWPVIIKPADRSGSRGICLAQNIEQALAGVLEAYPESFSKEILAEEFIEGKEYSVEYVSSHGQHHFLALTEKMTTGAPHFIETGHMQPADVDEKILESIQKLVPEILDTLHIKEGASHTEIKIDDSGKIGIIETGGRMGGDGIGSHLTPASTGIDFVKAVIDASLKQPLDLSAKEHPAWAKSVFIMNEQDLEEMNLLQKDPGLKVEVLDLNPENLNHITDSSTRAGCYIVTPV